jgi:hypothetical protein
VLPFALEFGDSFDLTAVGTLTLAVVTLWLVLVSRRALRQAQMGIEQTQREIELSRQEVEEAHRPVLVPIIDDFKRIQPYGSDERAARPFWAPSSHLVVPVANIGSGPALDVELALTPRNDAGDFSDAWGDAKHTSNIVGVGVGAVSATPTRIPELSDGVPNFEIWITYLDVAGKQWVTSAKYLIVGGGRYIDLSIDRGELGSPKAPRTNVLDQN